MDRRQFVDAAALGVVGTLAAQAPATAKGVTRVGAWGAAAFGLDGVTFGGNTARMVVHPGIGGTRPRLRLSNVAGAAPVAVRMLAAYDSGGGVHPNPAGYRAMAQAVDLSPLAPQAPALHR